MCSLNLRVGCIVLGLMSGACGKNAPTFSVLPTDNVFQGTSNSIVNNQIDVLWVIDNSGSMLPLQVNMTNNFKSFISNFQAKGYDFRMTVTTTDAFKADTQWIDYNTAFDNMSLFSDGVSPSLSGVFIILPTTPNLESTFVKNASQGANGDGDERAFSSMKVTLNNSKNPAFLRPQSFFAVIILSDEDDFSSSSRKNGSWTLQPNDPDYVPDHDYTYSKLDTVASYESFLDTLTGTTGATRRYNVSAITVMDQACVTSHRPQSPTTIIGTRYIQMATDTKGVIGSVCDSTYATSLANIQDQIALLSTKFSLTRIPVVSTIQVVVNGVVVPNSSTDGWTYDAATNAIFFHGLATPAQGDNIQVNFTPTTVMTS